MTSMNIVYAGFQCFHCDFATSIRSITKLGNVIRGLNLNKNPSAQIKIETSQNFFSAKTESLIKVSVWKITGNVSIFLS